VIPPIIAFHTPSSLPPSSGSFKFVNIVVKVNGSTSAHHMASEVSAYEEETVFLLIFQECEVRRKHYSQ
jgi:hypothetical protein